jgi:hypothetical protein
MPSVGFLEGRTGFWTEEIEGISARGVELSSSTPHHFSHHALYYFPVMDSKAIVLQRFGSDFPSGQRFGSDFPSGTEIRE